MGLDAVFTEFPCLETERFRLRPIDPQDAKLVFHYLSDDEASRYVDFKADSLRWAQGHVQNLRRRYRHREWLRWAIERKADGLYLGMCGYHGIAGEHRAEIGYELGREHWNQGVMTEVLHTVVPFGFDTMGLHRIQAWAAVANPASARVLLKAGFAEEGRLRDYLYIPHRNAYEDVAMFGALGTDSGWRK
jgi:[ribosomal protein S5]-alanine N-acetyltransferase